jgi:hypothetical protein
MTILLARISAENAEPDGSACPICGDAIYLRAAQLACRINDQPAQPIGKQVCGSCGEVLMRLIAGNAPGRATTRLKGGAYAGQGRAVGTRYRQARTQRRGLLGACSVCIEYVGRRSGCQAKSEGECVSG